MLLRIDDKLSIPSERKIQDTGAMIAKCAIARTGNLKYKAKELGEMFKDRDPESIVVVAQLQDDLFSDDTLNKFRSAPVTIGHPEDDVNTENMKELSKGMLEGKPTPDGDKLEANIVLQDKEAIDLVEDGTVELSACAYYNITRMEDSELGYDAVREVTRVNHVAIVERGRAGRECKIYDADPFDKGESKEVYTKLQDAETKLQDAEEKIIKLEAKVDDLTAKLEDTNNSKLTEKDLDNALQKRKELHERILKVSDVDITGLSEIEAKRKAVEARAINTKDKHDAYVEARFDILLEDAEKEQETHMQKALKDSIEGAKQKQEVRVSKAEQARINMIKRFEGGQ